MLLLATLVRRFFWLTIPTEAVGGLFETREPDFLLSKTSARFVVAAMPGNYGTHANWKSLRRPPTDTPPYLNELGRPTMFFDSTAFKINTTTLATCFGVGIAAYTPDFIKYTGSDAGASYTVRELRMDDHVLPDTHWGLNCRTYEKTKGDIQVIMPRKTPLEYGTPAENGRERCEIKSIQKGGRALTCYHVVYMLEYDSRDGPNTEFWDEVKELVPDVDLAHLYHPKYFNIVEQLLEWEKAQRLLQWERSKRLLEWGKTERLLEWWNTKRVVG